MMKVAGNRVVVIGAGIVGVCCAVYLRDEGFQVTLVDRNEPGTGASFGNLGVIGIASCPPLALPGIFWQVPGMLLDRDAPLKLRLRDLPETAPWLIRALATSSRSRVRNIARARQSLIEKVHLALDPLVDRAGCAGLLDRKGLLYTFESEEVFRSSGFAFDLRLENGVEMECLDGPESRQVEPSLSREVVRSWFVPSLSHVRDPHRLVASLAKLFAGTGGEVLRADVTELLRGPDNCARVRTDGPSGDLHADHIVIAAGAWSRRLVRTLGLDVPLIAERGYHTVYERAEPAIKVPLISVDRKIAVTPMNAGIRVGGLTEFANVDAAADMRMIDVARRHAEALLPGLQVNSRSEWMGPRPSFPDSIPAIGPAPGLANVWFAFGHDHLGLTMGAITGRLISEMISGKKPCVDPAPFSPLRFGD